MISVQAVAEAFMSATNEAKNAFGNGEMFLEKFITKPRHIEVQVMGRLIKTIFITRARERLLAG
jgi:acetyl-CoA/propionyl-CoA carboxylase biotin carboxyl carrier protein